jgi:hypothetical protein
MKLRPYYVGSRIGVGLAHTKRRHECLCYRLVGGSCGYLVLRDDLVDWEA